MAQVMLAFELDKEKDRVLQEICDKLGIKKVNVSVKDYAQKLGYLAGITGFAREKIAYNGGAFSAEMLVFSGVASDQLDAFLSAYAQSGLTAIGLKAVLTQHNVFWTAEMLYHAIQKEHH